ncbi:MAG: ABC transporter permease [Chloroflexi bacterium]|nr:ABC transporter permease [Chloroflexota bacterium]
MDRTLEIDATLPPGSITATVGMVVGHDELDDLNLLSEELELHVFDEASSRWVPAGVNIGESAPTDIVGESGYVPNADDTITYWAVRDTLSLFAVGATAQRIVFRHIAPNCFATYLILASYYLGFAIIIEASLSFLGVGAPPDVPSWGGILTQATREHVKTAPWVGIFPGMTIFVVVLGFNLLGDALRDVFDPKLRGR